MNLIFELLYWLVALAGYGFLIHDLLREWANHEG